MKNKLNFKGTNIDPKNTVFTEESLKRFREEIKNALLDSHEDFRLMKIKNYELAITRVIG